MLTQVEIELQLPEGTLFNQSMGSILQGALMEQVAPAWAEAMHTQNVRPYSQYGCIKEGKPIWRIHTLTEEAAEQMLSPLLRLSSLYLKQRNQEIGLSHFQIVKQETFKEIEEKYWGTDKKIHHMDMNFLTSASCKSQGGYAIFPMPHLIFKNLIKKWNAFSDGSTMEEVGIADQLAQQMDITDYQLHMHPFSLEGRRIRAFRGKVRYGFFKNDAAARLAATLADFANYAGTGMKTSMGMGGTEAKVEFYKSSSV